MKKNTGNFRKLQPAAAAPSPPASSSKATGSAAPNTQSAGQSNLPKKRAPVAVACANCQKKKSKCSGQRPKCSTCENKGLECRYDIKDSVQGLRNTTLELVARLKEAQNILVQVLPLVDSNHEMHALIRTFLHNSSDSAKAIVTGTPEQVVVTPGQELLPSWKASPAGSHILTTSPIIAGSLADYTDPGPDLARSSWHPVMHTGGASWGMTDQMNRMVSIYQQAEIPDNCIELYGNMETLSELSILPGSARNSTNARFALPQYLVQPLWKPELSPLGNAYVEFRTSARSLLAGGSPLPKVMGPDYVSADSFFEARAVTDPVYVCNWACDVSSGLRDIDIHIRLAMAFFLTRLMKWMILPTEESWMNVPEMIRPTPSQRFIPHSPVIDMAIVPPLREALCTKFQDWTAVMAESARLYWPHPTESCFEFDHLTGRNTRITEVYEEHVQDMDNWSFGEEILDEFPELHGKLNIFSRAAAT